MSTLTTAHTLSQKAPPHTTPSPRTPHHLLTPHPTPPPHPAPFCMTFPSPSGIAVALEALREQRRAAYFYQLCDPSPSPPAAAPSLPPCSAHPVCAAARQHIHSEASAHSLGSVFLSRCLHPLVCSCGLEACCYSQACRPLPLLLGCCSRSAPHAACLQAFVRCVQNATQKPPCSSETRLPVNQELLRLVHRLMVARPDLSGPSPTHPLTPPHP